LPLFLAAAMLGPGLLKNGEGRMTVRLRPHHLLCMLTYAGEGYSSEFIVNCDEVVARISAGAPVIIVSGPDDICAPRLREDGAHSQPHSQPHCLDDSVRERDRLAARDLAGLIGSPLRPGVALECLDTLAERMRGAFLAGQIRSACAGCEWHALCTSVAGRGFRDARLSPPGNTVLPRSLPHHRR